MKTIILFTIILFVFFPMQAYSAKSVLDFGAVPDDGNDDTQAIIDAVASGEDIYFPDGVYNVSSNIMLNSKNFQDNSLYALNYKGAVIKGNGDARLKAHYFYKIKNFVFDNIGIEIFGGDERNKTRYFESNEFINLPQDVPCVVLNGFYGPVGHIHIHHNRFIGGRHTVIGDIKNSTIEYNYSEGCKRNYEFHDYAENVIVRFNELHGGIVGIGFFCTHNGNDNVKFGNIIEYNKCYDQSEEGISFDNFGNRSDSYSRYTGLVTDYKSNSGKATRLYLNTTPGKDLKDRYAFFVDDNKTIKGFHSKIIEMGVEENISYIDLRSGPDDDLLYENARIVVLTYPAKQNKIRYNIVKRVGRSGIVFHGAGNFNLIEYNVVVDCNHELPERHDFWGGISLRNMNSANIPGVHGPVFYNIVRNNTASGIRCDINAYNLNYGQEVFVAIGNEVYDNTYLNGALKDVRAADNEPGKDIPSIEISDPADYTSVSREEEFSINATLEHFDNADSVVLLQNAKKIDVLYSAPYEFEIQGIDSGSHVFQVVGIGSAGDIKVCDHITVLCGEASPISPPSDHSSQKIIKTTDIILTHDNITLNVNETRQLTAQIEPANATFRFVNWSSDNEGIVMVDENGLITANSEGIANITATSEDGEVSESIKIIVDPMTGIQNHHKNKIMAFPNPVEKNGTINVNIPDHLSGYAQIKMFDLLGRSIWYTSKHVTGHSNLLINFNNKITKGIFYMSFQIDNYKETCKIMVN